MIRCVEIRFPDFILDPSGIYAEGPNKEPTLSAASIMYGLEDVSLDVFND